MDAKEPFWLKFSYLGQEQSCPSAGQLPTHLRLECGFALGCLWTLGKKAWSPTASEHLASCSREGFPGSWRFWRFDRSHCLPWTEVSSGPFQQKCIPWTTNLLLANSASSSKESLGICTKGSQPHVCKSWWGIRKLWPTRNQRVCTRFRHRWWVGFMASSLCGKSCFDARTRGTARSGKGSSGSAEEGELSPSFSCTSWDRTPGTRKPGKAALNWKALLSI